ncbi:GFA family protein [Rhodoblastus sp.]|uniref:GFA family protein n=1 Tax=Rhodoblastus sp. TaxID=1962975 RepID=UPI003F9A3081
MPTSLKGGCLCGRIRYECGEQPIVQMICHCRDCQRASGSAYASLLIVPRDRLAYSGVDPNTMT